MHQARGISIHPCATVASIKSTLTAITIPDSAFGVGAVALFAVCALCEYVFVKVPQFEQALASSARAVPQFPQYFITVHL